MTEKRESRSLPVSTKVYSTVHKGTPCTDCILCKETQPQYTHPASWINKELLILLRKIEPKSSEQTAAFVVIAETVSATV